ncbi:unnamed protein product [Vicia faba]|uniref:Uncharacterized protein n=1 Tax=Vicia faba TaxID=3906 RepID=A0AAV0Z1G2_VICFA|nr:unnamed protein product [Vicia faba]
MHMRKEGKKVTGRQKSQEDESHRNTKVTGRRKSQEDESHRKTKVTGRRKSQEDESHRKTKVTGRRKSKEDESYRKTKVTGRRKSQEDESHRKTKVTGRRKSQEDESHRKTKVTGRRKSQEDESHRKTKHSAATSSSVIAASISDQSLIRYLHQLYLSSTFTASSLRSHYTTAPSQTQRLHHGSKMLLLNYQTQIISSRIITFFNSSFDRRCSDGISTTPVTRKLRLRSDEGFGDGLKLFVLEGDGVLLKVNEDVKWLQLLVKKDD